MTRILACCALVGVLTAGCASSGVGQRQAEALDDGVQATGRIGGARVAISDGGPETNLTDCDPGIETDADVCWIARTIDGDTIAFVIENPAALVPGERIAVREDDCETCDDVTDHAVVELRLDGQARRAVSGSLEVQQADERFAARFDVRLADGGTLNGRFNIRQHAPGEGA